MTGNSRINIAGWYDPIFEGMLGSLRAMAARVVQKFVSDNTDGEVNPLMAAMGPNVAGVIGSAVAAGVFLTLLQ